MTILTDKRSALFDSSAAVFTHPTSQLFLVLVEAAIITSRLRTVADLKTAGSLAPGHDTSDRRVFSKAYWSALRLACVLADTWSHCDLRPIQPRSRSVPLEKMPPRERVGLHPVEWSLWQRHEKPRPTRLRFGAPTVKAIHAIWKDGRIIPTQPVDWPDGTTLTVEPVEEPQDSELEGNLLGTIRLRSPVGPRSTTPCRRSG
jgi:hypothetical protein